MYLRLLSFLRCPECRGHLKLAPLISSGTQHEEDVSEGLLCCDRNHAYPIVRGIPRMLPEALEQFWGEIEPRLPKPIPVLFQRMRDLQGQNVNRSSVDTRTRANFSEEWNYHELGGDTWGMNLEDRVEWFFLQSIRIPAEKLSRKVMLDAGCGNGSQSVAYTEHGLEVIALDLSSGLELGQAYRLKHPGAYPARVHFVQGDLLRPPLAPSSVDIIHSAGVLHHTPDTYKTFQALRPILRPGGTFYVWVYKYEQYVTPIVNAVRAVTTKIPAPHFARIAKLMAAPFQGFCAAVNALGVRAYPRLNRREAALALMDIFGAPYAHYHSYEEVEGWFEKHGFNEIWGCNDGRRGFGVCGRLAVKDDEEELKEIDLPLVVQGGEA